MEEWKDIEEPQLKIEINERLVDLLHLVAT